MSFGMFRNLIGHSNHRFRIIVVVVVHIVVCKT